MKWRVVRASALLEWRRNASAVLKLLVAIGICGVLAAVGPRPVMLFAMLVAGAVGVVITGGGALTAIRERHLGRVAWWRTVPAPRFELMLGRLLGAGLLGVGFGLGLVPMITVGLREGLVVPAPATLGLMFVVASISGFGVAAVTTGLALRFRIERALMALFLISFLLGDRFEAAMEASLGALGRWVLATADGSVAFVLPVLAAVVAALGLLMGLGLARWGVAAATEEAVTSDVTGISRINWRRIRYPAGQRGPVRSLCMLQLRLAAERLPQQLAFIVGGVVVLPMLPEQWAAFAAIYLPIMAVTIPAAVAGRTATARMSGTIEGLATLPVRREWVVLGTLLATAALALVAVVGVVMLRFAADQAISVVSAFALWGLIAGGSSVANGMAAWFTPRHLPIVMVFGFGAISLAALALLPIVMAPMSGGAFAVPQLLQALVGMIGLLLVAPLGGALYGRGLERFELVRK